MKLWRFSIDHKGWYFDGEQLVAPHWILASLLLFPIYYLSLGIHCLITAGYHREWYYAVQMWRER